MKKMIFLMACFFGMINNVWAITLTCPEVASPKEAITCRLEDDQYIGLKANYDFDSVFTYNNMTNLAWKKYYYSPTGFSVGNVGNSSKLSMDIELSVSNNAEVNQDYQVRLTKVEAVDADYKYVKLADLTSVIKVVSNINTLKSLEVVGESLKPSFDKNTTEYSLTTYNDSVLIKATATSAEAVITGDVGEKKLDYGANVFVVNVTSVRGEVKNYYLYITREKKKNSDITLKSLVISSGKINFTKDKFIYTTDVDYGIETVKVEAVPTSDKAVVTIEQPDKLVVGKNNINIIVTAENGDVGKYTIIVNRRDKLSSDTTIKSLNITGYQLAFDNNTYEYELKIGNEDMLDIQVVLNDSKSKYKITGNSNLVNNSQIVIQVTAEDGGSQKYIIKVLKSSSTSLPDESTSSQETDNVDTKENDDSLKDLETDEAIDTSPEDNLVNDTSSSVLENIKVIPIVGFVILILVVIIVKIVINYQSKLGNDK